MILSKPVFLPQFLWDVLLFLLLIFSFHFIYLGWSGSGFYPVADLVHKFFNYAGAALFHQSAAVLNFIGFAYTPEGQTFHFFNRTGGTSWIGVSPECTSLKQWLHWIFLMVFFPGPRKHKAWFIPAGLIILQAVSILRITGLVLALSLMPSQFHLLHDLVFKAFFYGVLFLMWAYWEEKFNIPVKSTR